MPDVPPLVIRPVPVHHPRHLVHRCRSVRGARHPSVPHPLDPVLAVAVRPAPECPRAHTKQFGRLLLRQPFLRPHRMRVLEHHQPPVLLTLRHAHTASTASSDAVNVRPDTSCVLTAVTLGVPYTETHRVLTSTEDQPKISLEALDKSCPPSEARTQVRAFAFLEP